MAAYDEVTRQALAPIMEEVGLALHSCQMFEYSLCMLLSLLAEHSAPAKGESFQKTWDFHSPKPMGRLLNALREEVDVPEEFGQFLAEGIRLRNHLVHNFFHAVGFRIMEPKARLEIVREVRGLRREIQSRDRALEPLVDSLLKKYGVSTDSLKRDAGKFWDWANYETEDRKPRKDQ